MANISIKKGTIIYKEGTTVTTISRIISGAVKMICACGEITLEKDDLLGVVDLTILTHSSTYIAAEDTVLSTYVFNAQTELSAFLSENEGLTTALLRSAVKQICSALDEEVFFQYECNNMYSYLSESYEEYKKLCNKYAVPVKTLPGLLEVDSFHAEDDIPDWLGSYYEESADMLSSSIAAALFQYPALNAGYLMRFCEDFHTVLKACREMVEYRSKLSFLLMNRNGMDLFDLYTNLLFRIMRDGIDTLSLSAAISKILIHIESIPSFQKELYNIRVQEYKKTLANIEEELASGITSSASLNNSSLENSLDAILKYANCSDETSLSFKRAISAYKKQVDKSATTDELRTLRREITSLFYEIYTCAFQASTRDSNIPTVLKMFLKFGYVDEELAGPENAAYLYSIADSYTGNKKYHVYTIFDWLNEIHQGNKEPRRNEFDVDYAGHVHELKTSGKIDANKEKEMLTDTNEKVLFEIQNMFTLANKMTSGRIATFTPVFSEHTVLASLESILATPEKIASSLIQIQKIDYSAFYRDALFYNASLPIPKENIKRKILPDIILMPNMGNRGVMWQELEGKSRSTPACYILPTFCQEELALLLLRATGEYRWEICRRTQGARWNDLSDPSLTSEYFDYVQFYRKNSELSPDAKEKIKTALAKARNSFKEMFVNDYIIWVLYEGKGSPRMNKVARRILFTYCPFPQAIRDQLKSNPLYGEIMEKWQIKRAQENHRLSNILKRLENSGIEIPKELQAQQAFLNM
ncbi:MAG: Crp/Fnr family transcriptional regulator [Lachnospiraceae bacterium]|nr:Crp/Fnr family transcriptional regulator [Lachnospiraceae bacterium]